MTEMLSGVEQIFRQSYEELVKKWGKALRGNHVFEAQMKVYAERMQGQTLGHSVTDEAAGFSDHQHVHVKLPPIGRPAKKQTEPYYVKLTKPRRR